MTPHPNSVHRWLAACLLAASATAAQAETSFSIDTPQPVAGSSFTLFLGDDEVPVSTGYSDSDIWLVFDAAVLTFSAASAGNAFGIANIVVSQFDPNFFGFTITRDTTSPQPATFGQALLTVTFDVKPSASSGPSNVAFHPAFATPITAPGYYNLTAASVDVPITAVPEPTSAALLLAGIGLAAAVARRRLG